MEKVVFLEAGAWKSIEELEDILILEELSVLYEEAIDKEHRFTKVIAMALGAEFPDEEDSQSTRGGRVFDSETGGYIPSVVTGAKDVAQIPVSIGYESSL